VFTFFDLLKNLLKIGNNMSSNNHNAKSTLGKRKLDSFLKPEEQPIQEVTVELVPGKTLIFNPFSHNDITMRSHRNCRFKTVYIKNCVETSPCFINSNSLAAYFLSLAQSAVKLPQNVIDHIKNDTDILIEMDLNGNTPLFYLLFLEKVPSKLVTDLLNNFDINLSHQNYLGQTIFHILALSSSIRGSSVLNILEAMEERVQSYDTNPLSIEWNGKTPLQLINERVNNGELLVTTSVGKSVINLIKKMSANHKQEAAEGLLALKGFFGNSNQGSNPESVIPNPSNNQHS